jgi:hypothetical protein
MRLAGHGFATWTTLKRAALLSAVKALSAADCEAGELDLSDVESGILRAAQIWRPLIAIADVIGSLAEGLEEGEMKDALAQWPDRARAACENASEHDIWRDKLSSLDDALFGGRDERPALDDDEDDDL